MKTTINLHGWYGIENCEVEATATAGRDGIKVVVSLPAYLFEEKAIAVQVVTWDEYEADPDRVLSRVGGKLASRIVLACKRPGQSYAADEQDLIAGVG